MGIRTRPNPLKFVIRVAVVVLTAAGLYHFLGRSLPELPGLRVLLVGVGLIVAAAAAIRPWTGWAAYLGLLVLANNWPYYFGLEHNMPYVHTAVILFGFFILGWGFRWLAGREAEGTAPVSGAILRPMRLAAALIAVSGAVTFWRWTNFFPLRSRGVYEWMTNTNGLPASLARTSVGLSVLSYLLPFAFFWIFVRVVRDRARLEKMILAVGLAVLAAVLFGFFQYFLAPGLGNTDFWVFHKQINATFKDPNAFGGVLAVLLPLFFGAAVALTGKGSERSPNEGVRSPVRRNILAAVFILGALIFPLIGARSALLAFAAGMAVVAALAFRFRSKAAGPEDGASRRSRTSRKKRLFLIAAIVLVALAAGVLSFRSRFYERLSVNIREIAATGDFLRLSPERYFLWKHALAMTGDYPFTGVGAGAFLVELPDYYAKDKAPVPPGFEGYKRLDTTENYYLHAAAELGLIGLLAMLAVFAAVAREVVRGIKAGLPAGPDRWLFLGAAGGLVAFVINALFHTFSQSFETLFFFWFPAAVVVVLRANSGTVAAEVHASRIPRKILRFPAVLAVALIVLYGAVHLRNSSGRLSIVGKTNAYGIGQEFGLYLPEKDEEGRPFRWTRTRAAWPIDVSGRIIQIPLMISHPDVAQRPVHLRVSMIPDTLRGQFFLGEPDWTTAGWKTLEFPIPPEISGKAMILLEIDRAWSPKEESGSKDNRWLGAKAGQVTFR